MLENLKAFLESIREKGLPLPMVYDASTGKPSVTLLNFYLAIVITAASVIGFHFAQRLLEQTLTSLMYLTLSFVFYRLRSLDKVKIDLKNKSVELEDEPDAPTNKE